MGNLRWGLVGLGLVLGLSGCDDGGDAAPPGGGGGAGGGEADQGPPSGCPAGERACGGECVILSNDARHCGGCGNACAAGQRCVEGNCRAPTGEACNGLDDDQDGRIDEGDDGQALEAPCDNLCGPGVRRCQGGQLGACSAPAPTAEICDGLDNDCDGKIDEGVLTTWYRDADGDGRGDPSLANAVQTCDPPGDGYVDNIDDCDDDDPTTYAGAEERCDDDRDNDCDGVVNDDCPCPLIGDTRPCGSDEGACRAGVQTCTDTGWSECGGERFIPPAEAEICSGSDDDCDGQVDENLPEDPWEANDTCALARVLPNVEEDAEPLIIGDATLYKGGTEAPADVDWFRVRAREGFGLCVPGFRECGLTLGVVFRLPERALRDDYTLCLHYDDGEGCAAIQTSWCVDVDSDGAWDDELGGYRFAVQWDGRCGLDSSRDFLIEVRSPTGINACSPYTLGLAFSELDAECGDGRSDPELVEPAAGLGG